jgi:hypothetical protein
MQKSEFPLPKFQLSIIKQTFLVIARESVFMTAEGGEMSCWTLQRISQFRLKHSHNEPIKEIKNWPKIDGKNSFQRNGSLWPLKIMTKAEKARASEIYDA